MPRKLIALLLALIPFVCFSQVVINPGEQVIIKAGSCPVVTCPPAQTIYIHDTVWQCPPTVPPVNPPPPSTSEGYNLTYSNGFDKSSDLSADQLGKGSISPKVFKSGTGSFKSVVSVGDVAISSGFRSEQQYTGAAQNPVIGKLSYDVLYESFQQPGWGGSSIQWHPQGGGSAFLFLETAEGSFSVYQYKKGYSSSFGKITLNQWYHVDWEFFWSQKADGYAKLFIDGKNVWSYSGPMYEGGLPYIKLGQNFFSNVDLSKGSQHGGTVYFDNLNIFTAK